MMKIKKVIIRWSDDNVEDSDNDDNEDEDVEEYKDGKIDCDYDYDNIKFCYWVFICKG